MCVCVCVCMSVYLQLAGSECNALSLMQVSGWSFLVGYLLQTLVSLLGAGSKSLSQPGDHQHMA